MAAALASPALAGSMASLTTCDRDPAYRAATVLVIEADTDIKAANYAGAIPLLDKGLAALGARNAAPAGARGDLRAAAMLERSVLVGRIGVYRQKLACHDDHPPAP
jgi:hypothetical protein